MPRDRCDVEAVPDLFYVCSCTVLLAWKLVYGLTVGQRVWTDELGENERGKGDRIWRFERGLWGTVTAGVSGCTRVWG